MADRSIKVRLQADVNAFVQEINRGSKSLDSLVKKSGDASGASASSLGRMVQSAKLQSDAWATVGRTATVASAAMIGVGTAIAKTGIEYNTLQQTSRAALTTLTGSAEAANAQMDKLDEFARTSPFSKSTFITAQQQMLAFGIESEKVIPYLSAINEAVAAAGGSSQTLSEVAFVVAQIGAAGKITATDLMQLGQRGINAAELIGSQMGMTGAQIRESITAGTLSADDALDALTAGMQEKFAGASANVKNTMGGAFDRLSAAWRDLSSEIVEGAVGTNGGGWLVDMTNGAADLLRKVQDLPEPVKEAAAGLSGIAGAGTVATAALAIGVPKFVQLWESVQALNKIAPSATSNLKKVGKAAGAAGLVVATLSIGLNAAVKERQGVDGLADAVERLGSATGDIKDFEITLPQREFLDMQISAQSLGQAVESLSYWQNTGWLTGLSQGLQEGLLGLDTAQTELEGTFSTLDSALVSLDTDSAQAAFAKMSDEMRGAGANGEWMAEQFPQYFAQVKQSLLDASVGGREFATDAEAIAKVAAGELPEGLVMTSNGLMSVEQAADVAAETIGTASSTLDEWTLAARMGTAASEDAAKAYASYVGEIAASDGSFIDVMGAWDSVIDKNKEVAQAAADASESAEDSWEDYYDGQSVNLKDYLAELSDQVKAQSDWESNMVQLSGKVSQGVLDHLAKLGPEGAPLVAELVNASDKELAQFEEMFGQSGDEATGAFADSIANANSVWTALMAVAGEDAVNAAKDELASGGTTLAEIVDRYNLSFVISANTAPAITQARATVDRINKMTATVRVKAYHANGMDAPVATGGYMADVARAYGLAGGGMARRRFPAGGVVTGPGTPTSDSVPAWLSRSEFVQNAAATSYYGTDFMYALNSRSIPREAFSALGFAGGGSPGTASASLTKTVATLNTGVFPLAEIAAFAKELKTATAPLSGLGKKAKDATKALSDADKAVADAEKRLAKAQKVDPDSRLGKAQRDLARAEKVVDPKSSLGRSRQAVRDAEEKLASAKGKKAREKAEKELERAQAKNQKKEDARQRKIDEARERVDYYQAAKDKRVAEAEKKLTKAQERQAKAQARQEKAADKLAEKQAKAEQAAKDLADAQQALADAAKSASESLRQTYMVGGDAADLLDNMRTGAKETAEFADLIEQLRKAGLDEDIIQEIIEQGATTGAETARDILSKGKTGIDDLNKAAANLRKATDDLGLKTAVGQKASGGLITGPGTGTSDSILTRTSNGEYVLRAASVASIGVADLDYANRYGRLPVTSAAGLMSSRAMGAYTVGYSVPQTDAAAIAQAVADALADTRIYMDGQVVDARIETRMAGTASRVRRGM